MEFRILGSLEVRADGGPVTFRGAKPRGLLAVLLLHANEPVSAERLAVALWGNDARADAVKTVQVNVSRLRRALGDPGVLVTTPAGYELRVAPGELDAAHFEQLAAEGHRALADGAPERAAETLREALELWRGPALAEFASEPFAQAEIRRLEDERLAASEARVESELALGRHVTLVGELEELIAAHPLRERLHGLLMVALYRSGRQADALAAYRRARDVLVDQLGIEPGPDLRALERAVLAQDRELDPPAARPVERPAAARLPAPPTPIVGREADLAALQDILGEMGERLVTVVGPGGVGKTRLALELARDAGDRFRDGAYFVSLAPVKGHEHVASTMTRELGIVLMPSESAEAGLARHLGDRDVLLVVDNFEHVLGAAPMVAELLAATTSLKVLVTSREPLRLRAERLFQLEPLELPSVEASGAGAEDAPAVALFLAVARARDPSFERSEENRSAAALVCRRVDGLPLAIELAGARIGLLSAPELATRLADGVGALGTGARDAPARQRTLTATLEWSHELLTGDERKAFASLAVFAGGCTLDAAQAVTGSSLDVLEGLVAKNLVVRRPAGNGQSRLLLLETVRDFAVDRLAARGDGDEVHRRHLDYYLAVAERGASELERSDSPATMMELDLEVDNLRGALSWALDRSDPEGALRLATAQWWHWDRRDPGAGADWLRRALALPADRVSASVRAAALTGYSSCLWVDDIDEAVHAARQGLELARSAADIRQCSASANALSGALLLLHRAEEAYHYATEAERLARAAGDEPKLAHALESKAVAAPTFDEALALGEEAAGAFRSAGSNRRLALLQTSLTYNALLHGDHGAATRLTPEALQSAENLGDTFVVAFACGNLGLVSLLAGDAARASEAFTRELQIANRHQYELMFYEAINGLAAVAAARGDDELAARLYGAAESRPERHDPRLARQLESRFFSPARTRLGEGPWERARATGSALSPREAMDAAMG
jgi:predicted ATPase/DNA-binding SARP family transcriptional activator